MSIVPETDGKDNRRDDVQDVDQLWPISPRASSVLFIFTMIGLIWILVYVINHLLPSVQ